MTPNTPMNTNQVNPEEPMGAVGAVGGRVGGTCCENTAEMDDPRKYLMSRANSLRSLANDIRTFCNALPVELSETQKSAIYRLAASMTFTA